MPSIGYATLEIIPSLQGVTEAIEKQVEGKVVNVTIEPKVDQRAAEKAGQQAKETVEKSTKEVKVEPKVDQKAAEDAGKKTGEAVAKGASGSSSAVGQAIIGALQGAGEEGGRLLGEKLSQNIPTGMTGAAKRIGDALRNSLPTAGAAAGTALATSIGIALTDAIGKERLDRAGKAVMGGLTRAVNAANTATDIGVSIGNKIAGGLTTASGVVSGAAATITNTIGDVQSGLGGLKQFIGGDDSFAAPALDGFNDALGKATPLLNAVTGATTLAATGAQAISVAVGMAQKAQLLWNIALTANPIGLIVAAIAAVVAGLVLFFTRTELGRKIWQGFTEYLKIAWEGIKIAFSAAWDVIKGIWDGMVKGAQLVWSGIKNEFTMIVDFVKGLPAAIGGAAKGMWDGIGNAFKFMINGLIRTWNMFANALSFKVPDWVIGIGGNEFKLPTIAEFTTGGYTGSMPADKIAGVVHGGEYVINASSTSGIQNAMPGLLDYLNNKGPLPGYADGGLVAGTAELRNIIAQKFGISGIGGWRPQDKYGEHSTGRALDVPVGNNKAAGDAIKDFAVENASAIDLKWAIWQQKLWYPGGGSKAMQDRGSPTQNHMDHVHIFSGTGITNGLRGALSSQTAQSAPSAMEPGAGVNAPDQTGDASSSQDSSSGVTLASSISQLSGMGFDAMGNGAVSKPGQRDPNAYFPKAGSAAVTGQVASALNVFGIGDTPGWLKGISEFVGGISVGGPAGGAGASPLGGSVSPTSAIGPAINAATNVVSSVIGGQTAPPVSQTTYNIQTTDIEPAYLASQRQEKERAAAQMAAI